MDPMTGITAAVTCCQAGLYFANVVTGLIDLCKCIKNRKSILRAHYSNIDQLKGVIVRLSRSEHIFVTAELRSVLASIERISQALVRIFEETKSLKATLILVTQRDSVNEKFAILERQKSTLLLYLTTESTLVTSELAARYAADSHRMCCIPLRKKRTSVPPYRSEPQMPSSPISFNDEGIDMEETVQEPEDTLTSSATGRIAPVPDSSHSFSQGHPNRPPPTNRNPGPTPELTICSSAPTMQLNVFSHDASGSYFEEGGWTNVQVPITDGSYKSAEASIQSEKCYDFSGNNNGESALMNIQTPNFKPYTGVRVCNNKNGKYAVLQNNGSTESAMRFVDKQDQLLQHRIELMRLEKEGAQGR